LHSFSISDPGFVTPPTGVVKFFATCFRFSTPGFFVPMIGAAWGGPPLSPHRFPTPQVFPGFPLGLSTRQFPIHLFRPRLSGQSPQFPYAVLLCSAHLGPFFFFAALNGLPATCSAPQGFLFSPVGPPVSAATCVPPHSYCVPFLPDRYLRRVYSTLILPFWVPTFTIVFRLFFFSFFFYPTPVPCKNFLSRRCIFCSPV